ncbi:uncharacterized protein LOC129752029 [Uranotaenia lowii]|uniref:uncharacterized protein LOC129752029 n=1 Tax=Uranotaenia lowii TaxID=190385 RepID=UPI00247AA175|nr:uncharacterized protein LOC129752029 [Uranotaenia lowii]
MITLGAFGILLLIAFVTWEVYLRTRPSYAASTQFPGRTVWPLVQNMFMVMFKGQEECFMQARRWAREFRGQSYRFLVYGVLFVQAINYREVEMLLSSSRLIRKSYLYRFTYPFIGKGLLNSSGEKWHQRRRILTPTFHFNILQGFLQIFHEESDKLVGLLNVEAESEREVHLQPLSTRVTLNSICETAMGVKLDSTANADQYKSNVRQIGRLIQDRLMNPVQHNEFLYRILGYMERMNVFLKPVHEFTRQIIKQRREEFLTTQQNLDELNEGNIYTNVKQRYAMLDSLLLAEARQQIDEKGIQEEVDTFTFEGHDTTGSAFVFIFLILANHQDAQQKVFEELQSKILCHTNSNKRLLTIQDYSELKYMERVIKETLRLYPPVPFISRVITEDVKCHQGGTIPQGTVMNIELYDLHRDPEQFPDPERFDPDRFLPQHSEQRSPYAYIPFSAGPRNCIDSGSKEYDHQLVLHELVLEHLGRLSLRTVEQMVERRPSLVSVRREQSFEMEYFTIALLLIVVLLVVFELYQRSLPAYRAFLKYPHPKPWILLGNAPLLLFNNPTSTFALLRKWAAQFKASYSLFVRGTCTLNIIRADEAEVVLSSPRLIEKSILYQFIHPFIGDGLLNSTGTKWFHRRKILTPAFHFNILPRFLLIFHEECDKLIKRLNKDAQQSQTTVIQDVASRFTLNVICETAMGVHLDTMDSADQYHSSIHKVIEVLVSRVMNPWLYEDLCFKIFGYKARQDKLLKPIHNFTRNIIKQRRVLFQAKVLNTDTFSEENIYLNTTQRYALLDTLLAAEANHQIDEEGIREEVDTFMFEGHDTTASAFTFIFLMLAQHPKVQQLVYEEIITLASNHAQSSWTVNDYSELKYMDRTIKECLRLYPPVPFMGRTITEDTKLSGDRLLPKDSFINVFIYDLHRDPDQFPEPERFDPDRFLPENVKNRNPYAYVPFSAGPRNCIGQRFAMLELKAIVAAVLQNFRVLPVTKPEDIVFVADLVLRARDPILVKFERRD